MGDLDPPSPRQVAIEVKFLLQFQRLETRVRLSASLALGCSNRKGNKKLSQCAAAAAIV